MINKLHALFLFLICSLGIVNLSAQSNNTIQYQIADDQTEFEQALANAFRANDFFDISNVSVNGQFDNNSAFASFTNAEAALGIENGLFLANASVSQFIGGNTATGIGNNLEIPGSSNLSNLAGAATFDGSTIQFSFIPSKSNFSFDYVFASEEYCDFVGSLFNDVIGVFLSGPGITGPYTVSGMPAINLAEFTDANGDLQLVNVNNINNTVNNNLYVDNNIVATSQGGGSCPLLDVSNNPFTSDVQFDGWTVPLRASYDNLQVGETYYIEIAIADVIDAIFGSAIYLASSSFDAGAPDANLTADAGFDTSLQCDVTTTNLGGVNTSIGSVYTYEWVDESGQVISTEAFVAVDAPGEYTLRVTNTLTTQVATDIVFVSDLAIPTVSAIALSNISCITPEVTIEGNTDIANPEYFWEGTSAGNIVSDPTSKDITVNTAGEYILTVTNLDNGCASSTSVEVLIDTESPKASAQVSGVLTCNNITATLFANGDMTNTYEWSSQGTIVSDQSEINVNQAGVYELVVTNANNGCTATTTVEVLEDIEEPIVSIATPDILNCLNQEIIVVGNTNVSNAAYIWQAPPGGIPSGSTAKDIIVSRPGEYCLTVTNLDNGCTSSTCVAVLQDTESPQVTTQVSGILTCENETVILSANGEFSNAYEWFFQGATLGSQEVIEVSQPGIYELIVNNLNNGCTTTTSVEVLEDIESPFASIAAPEELNCATTSVLLDANASSSGSDITYIWSSFGTVIGNESTLEVADCGLYQLEVRNANNGCFTMVQVEVLCDQDLPIASIESPELLMLGGELALDASASSAGANFTYTWTTTNGNLISGINTLSPTINQPGSYCLTVLNGDNLCESIACVDVQQEAGAIPIAQAGQDQLLSCDITQVTLEGSGSSIGSEFTYAWTDSNGNVISTEITTMVSEPGIYTFTVTNTLTNEQASDTVIVNIDIEIVDFDILQPDILTCENANTTLSAFVDLSTLSFLWETLDGNIISDPTQNEIEVDQAGTYTVTLTLLTNGCSNTKTVTVEENRQTPTISISTSTPPVITCSTQNISLEGTTNINTADAAFEWNTLDGSILTNPSQSIIEVSDCGTYTLTVTDLTNGCTTQMDIIVECDISIPIADINLPELLEPGQAIQLDATTSSTGPNFEYTWTTDNGNIVSGGNTLTPTINQVGVYCLSVLDATNGCESTACVEVQQASGLIVVADAGPTQILTCNNQQVTLDGNGSSTGSDFTYSWTNAAGSEISTEITAVVSEPGNYTLTVTNTQTGEQAADDVEVLIDFTEPSVTIDIPVPSVLTCEVTEITLVLTTDLDPANADYQWEGPGIVSDATFKDATVNEPGEYTVVVTDTNNGCTTTQTATVTSSVNDIEFFLLISTCEENIVIDPADAFALFGFEEPTEGEWQMQDGLQIGDFPLATASMSGTYTFIGINPASFCEVMLIYQVVLGTNVAVDAGMDQEISCPQDEIILTATASPSNLIFQYNWTLNGLAVGAGESIVVSSPGVYIVAVTDVATGCISSDEVEVTALGDFLTVNVEINDVSCFGGDDGAITYDISGGVPPYTFTGGMLMQTGLAAGSYSITIIDNVQCSLESTIQISEPPALELIVEVTATGNLFAIPSGGVAPYDCSWSTGTNSCLLTNPDYSEPITLTITDANGCIITREFAEEPTSVRGLQSVELNVYPNPADEYIIINQEGIASALDELKLVDVRGRVLSVSHTVQDQDNIVMNMYSLSPGIYFLHVILDDKLFYQKVIVQ